MSDCEYCHGALCEHGKCHSCTGCQRHLAAALSCNSCQHPMRYHVPTGICSWKLTIIPLGARTIQGFKDVPCGCRAKEHDGVSHETEPRCESYFHEGRCVLPFNHEERHRDRWDISAICWTNEQETTPTYTHSELTTLLERMARLVVKETTQHVPVVTKEYGLSCSCGWQNSPVSSRPVSLNFISHISALLTPEKLQQLREAVERG